MSPILHYDPLGSPSPEGISTALYNGTPDDSDKFSFSPGVLASAFPAALKALAQTLPILEVPDYHVSNNANYQHGGIESGDEVDVVTKWPIVLSSTVVVELNNTMAGWLTDCDNVTLSSRNCTDQGFNDTCANCTDSLGIDAQHRNYWALILLLFPVFTVFGNVLVLLSVYKERSLQTVTNYFIVSLAVADLFVASFVMPFNVYDMYNDNHWNISLMWCDLWLAMDVIGSTCSIFNLIAISIDRYIAVTNPLQYAHYKSIKRVFITIAVVWLVSAGIGVPVFFINTPDPNADVPPDACLFHNAEFIIISSLSSFYIPCVIMIYLYIRIFKALRDRARRKKKPKPKEIIAGSVIENIAQTKKLAETTLGGKSTSVNAIVNPNAITGTTTVETNVVEEDKNTNNTSNSQDEEDEDDEDEGVSKAQDDECHIINNPKVTEPLPPLQEEKESTTEGETVIANHNGAPSASAAATKLAMEKTTDPSDSPEEPGTRQALLHQQKKVKINSKRNGSAGSGGAATGAEGGVAGKKDKKAAARFTIYKVNKASKKKREKSSAKRENKATKTLAIVLGAFLACWVPFFTINISEAIHMKFPSMWAPHETPFLFPLTTWLGYMNSFLNPVIYTIFNPEFRKAFKKILLSAKMDMCSKFQ